jgi:hypothetical protein
MTTRVAECDEISRRGDERKDGDSRRVASFIGLGQR